LGLRVPTDLSVVGYNGDAWAQLLPAPLTTITQPRLALGEQAAQLVLAECGQHGSHNGNGNGHAHENGAGVQPGRRVVLNPWLVIRESSGPAPGRL
jgi:LacI family repressor for deo operon, udp, cdd, tsx, nupC, and nupG